MTAVTFTVVAGPQQGARHRFDDRLTCLVGRALDCGIRLPDDDNHQAVSRHHCLLDINPPAIRVRDFGSLNGTFVNGQNIGQRSQQVDPGSVNHDAFLEHDLRSGDQVRVGGTVFRVEVDNEPRPTLLEGTGEFVPSQPRCARCGIDLSATVDRPGAMICEGCRRDPSALLASLPIQGDYQVIRELGRGGMGAVYLAEHMSTGRHVALKLLLPEVAAGEVATARFLREAEITRQLDHPNVVRLLDAGHAGGVFLVTLEYCAGGSLSAVAQCRHGSLAVDEVLHVLRQALAGVEHAHRLGVVHRDLKPQNLFLADNNVLGRIKVGDFGLAKAFDAAGLGGLTRTGRAAGTPMFVPRQQVIDFKNAQPEVDIWALAATAYHLLTGHAPRDFPRGRDPWLVILRDRPVPIRARRADVPPRLAEVIDAALDDRAILAFRSCDQFREALGGV